MIQTGDWIKINYTGRLQDNNVVFDTTVESVAKEAKLNSKKKFELFVMCVGEGHIIKGIDTSLIGKKVGDNYKIKLSAEEAFGKKNSKLLQLISKSKFTKDKVNPIPGLKVNIDGQEGIIKSISGGRVIVDFNHPLAGKDVEYEISINSIVTEDKEKIKGYLTLLFQQDIPFELLGKKILLKYPLPKEMLDVIEKEIIRLLGEGYKLVIPEIKKKLNTTEKQNKTEKSNEGEKPLNNQKPSENK